MTEICGTRPGQVDMLGKDPGVAVERREPLLHPCAARLDESDHGDAMPGRRAAGLAGSSRRGRPRATRRRSSASWAKHATGRPPIVRRANHAVAVAAPCPPCVRRSPPSGSAGGIPHRTGAGGAAEAASAARPPPRRCRRQDVRFRRRGSAPPTWGLDDRRRGLRGRMNRSTLATTASRFYCHRMFAFRLLLPVGSEPARAPGRRVPLIKRGTLGPV